MPSCASDDFLGPHAPGGERPDKHFPSGCGGFGPVPARIREDIIYLIFILAPSPARLGCASTCARRTRAGPPTPRVLQNQSVSHGFRSSHCTNHALCFALVLPGRKSGFPDSNPAEIPPGSPVSGPEAPLMPPRQPRVQSQCAFLAILAQDGSVPLTSSVLYLVSRGRRFAAWRVV